MKLYDYLPLIGRRISMFGLAALVSCFMLVGTSEAVAKATATTSLTQAQKLSKALKACKKLPKKKRAACVKRAKKKYATHHAVSPAAPTAPTGAATPPTAPVTPAAAGPVAPAGPTFAQIEALVCSFHCPILSFNILERGVPRLGTGVSTQRGGDGVPSDTWIFPLLVSYDKTEPRIRVGPPPLFESEPYTLTLHWRERTNAQIDASGALRIWVQAATETCEPALAGCGISFGGGA
jgi:hypothetical protein